LFGKKRGKGALLTMSSKTCRDTSQKSTSQANWKRTCRLTSNSGGNLRKVFFFFKTSHYAVHCLFNACSDKNFPKQQVRSRFDWRQRQQTNFCENLAPTV